MIEKIPLKAAPMQKVSVTVQNQDVVISLVPRLNKLYATVAVDKQVVVRERVCLHAVPIVNEAYRGLVGDLFFVDLQGNDDPNWQELGSRFVLCYTGASA